MLGFLLLVAGGFLHIFSLMSRNGWWENWGEFIFFVGLFVGVLGLVVPEKKTKIMSMALGISLPVTFAFAFIQYVVVRSLWYSISYMDPFVITDEALVFLYVIIAIAAYLILDRYVYLKIE